MKKVKSVLCFIVSIVFVFMLAIPVCAATSTGISPQSTDDVQFEFNFVALLGTHITDTNPDHMGWKENKSSVYLNVTQFPGNFYVYTNAYVNGSMENEL